MKHEQEWFDNSAKVLQKQAVEMADVRAVQYGIQARVYGTKIVLTFYYNQNKYHLNISGGMINFRPGKEAHIIQKYYDRQNHVTEHMAASADHVALPINRKPTNIKILEDKGVQACIDHINKKAARITKPELATLLKTTAQELTQYL